MDLSSDSDFKCRTIENKNTQEESDNCTNFSNVPTIVPIESHKDNDIKESNFEGNDVERFNTKAKKLPVNFNISHDIIKNVDDNIDNIQPNNKDSDINTTDISDNFCNSSDDEANQEECKFNFNDANVNYEENHVSIFEYIKNQITKGRKITDETGEILSEKSQQVYKFILIPWELEKFIFFGFFQCVDSFLYTLTFLPIRFVIALIYGFNFFIKRCILRHGNYDSFDASKFCDLSKGFVIISSSCIFYFVDVSIIYHIIRSQSIIKLYIFFNMLEVGDKLFTAFGQDIIDSLVWTVSKDSKTKKGLGFISQVILAIAYVVSHGILILFQATTINVAFNSQNRAMLTIMLSNNFVEIKGSAFKKFERNNLFQMACSDVRERFHLLIMLLFVCFRNLTEFSWNFDHFLELMPDLILVIVFEILVDCIKHAFITKFNGIPAEVYRQYTVSLAFDLKLSRKESSFGDSLDVVSRRMGLIPLPLCVIIIKIATSTISLTSYKHYLMLFFFFICLLSTKILISIIILAMAYNIINENHIRKEGSIHVFQVNNPAKKLTKLSRSKSVVVGVDKTKLSDLNTLSDKKKLERQYLSNSTVDLANVKLYDDDTDLNKNTKEFGMKRKSGDQTPLSEVERYTLINRII